MGRFIFFSGGAIGAVCGLVLGAFLWASFASSFKGVDYLAPHLTACNAVDTYVEKIADVPDIRYHLPVVVQGIHRQKTIDAVNELYDRAHCEPRPAAIPGVETFKTLQTAVVPDTVTMVEPAQSTAQLPAQPATAPAAPMQLHYPLTVRSSWRHTVIVRDDDDPPPRPLPPCPKPGELNFGNRCR